MEKAIEVRGFFFFFLISALRVTTHAVEIDCHLLYTNTYVQLRTERPRHFIIVRLILLPTLFAVPCRTRLIAFTIYRVSRT